MQAAKLQCAACGYEEYFSLFVLLCVVRSCSPTIQEQHSWVQYMYCMFCEIKTTPHPVLSTATLLTHRLASQEKLPLGMESKMMLKDA